MSLLLDSNALDSCIDSSGLTALHYSVQNKSASSAAAFVGGARDLTHLPNNEGRTPLMEAAAERECSEVLRALLKHKVVVKAVDSKDPQGMTSECCSKRRAFRNTHSTFM